jgi:hypothetical protein
VLLLGGSGTTDESLDARTVTTSGSAASSSTQSKFGGTSLRLPGASSYFTVPQSNDFNIDEVRFTIEFFCRFDSASANQFFWQASTSGGALFEIDSNILRLYKTAASGVTYVSYDWSSRQANTWYHVCVEYDQTTYRIYIDGACVATNATAIAPFGGDAALRIGARHGLEGFIYMQGYLDEFRWTKGVARYASNSGFTVPTSAYPRSGPATYTDPYFSQVELLLPFDGTDGATTTADASGRGRTVTAVGQAQLDTAQKKFGTASALFDSTTDCFAVPYASDLCNLSTATNAPFTIECWVRLAATGEWHALAAAYETSGNGAWMFLVNSSNQLQLRYYGSGSQETLTGTTLSANTWYHVMVDRNASGTIRMYINGVSVASVGTTGNKLGGQTSGSLRVGAAENTINDCLNGWIDDLRITKGVARAGGPGGYVVPRRAHPTS